MADKTALNTGYTYYADIVFACGFTDATGNFTELVTDTQIGVVSGTTSRSSDGTHGEFVSLESDDSEVNFGDNANWDGFANFTCMGLAQNDATSIPGGAQDSQYLFAKTGSGQDAFSALWQNSENWAGLVDTGSDVFASITDGLDDGTSGEVATNWNLLGLTYDGSDAYIRANESSSSASQTGSINATGHDLLLGNDTTGARGWLGNVAMFVILDIALSSAEWADIVADPTGEIFASGGTDVSVGTASLAVTTYAASITHDRNVAAATASLAVSTAAATVGLDTNVSANTTALSVATNAAAITYDVNVTAGPETLAVTTNAATIGYDVEVNVGTAALAVTTNQATISAGVNVQANAAALAVSAFQATITYDVEVNVGTAALAVTTNQATIAAGDSIDVQTAALALTTYPAAISNDVNVDAGVAGLSLSTNAASISSGYEIGVGNVGLPLHSGGWGAINSYESYLQRKRQRERERRERLEAIKELEDTDLEIARLMQKDLAREERDQEIAEFERIVRADDSARLERISTDLAKAYTRAYVEGTFSALEAFERQLQRVEEEEEVLFLAMLL